MDIEDTKKPKEVKVRKARFEKGSQEAKDYMRGLRDKRKSKKDLELKEPKD